MVPRKQLVRLRQSLFGRMDRLTPLQHLFYTQPASPAGRRACGYVCIEAFLAWESFARCFYLSCMTGTRTSTGVQVTAMRPAGKLVPAAANALPRKLVRSGHPAWHDIAVTLHLATHFRFSNWASVHIAAAFSVGGAECLRRCRNFFAHKKQDTKNKVLGYAQATLGIYGVDVYDALQQSLGGDPLLDVICGEIYTRATLMCQ